MHGIIGVLVIEEEHRIALFFLITNIFKWDISLEVPVLFTHSVQTRGINILTYLLNDGMMLTEDGMILILFNNKHI